MLGFQRGLVGGGDPACIGGHLPVCWEPKWDETGKGQSQHAASIPVLVLASRIE